MPVKEFVCQIQNPADSHKLYQSHQILFMPLNRQIRRLYKDRLACTDLIDGPNRN